MEILKPHLSCKSLSIGYESAILNNIDLEVSPGQCVLIKGENGSGKSTFLRSLFSPSLINGGRLEWSLSPHEISFLPQLITPFSFLSYSVQEVLELYSIETNLFRFLSPKILKKSWRETSRGEKQQVLILTRMSKKTKCLILDEAFNHLDQGSIGRVLELLKRLTQAHSSSLSILMTSHLSLHFHILTPTIFEIRDGSFFSL